MAILDLRPNCECRDDTNIVIVGDPPNLSCPHTKIRLKHAQPSVAAQASTKNRSTS